MVQVTTLADDPSGQSTATAVAAPPTTTAIVQVTIDPTTTVPPSLYPPVTLLPTTTTALPVGPPDPTGDTMPGSPLHLVVTSAEIDSASLSDPRYDPSLGTIAYHVGVGAIVRFVMTPSADWRTDAGRNFEVPHTADTSVLQQIVDRGSCTEDSVCATFVAVAQGTALVYSEGISGCGTQGCVASEAYVAAVIVNG